MTLKHLLAASAAALTVAACGNSEKDAEMSSDPYGALTEAGENAKDVKIKDKPGLSKTQRFANTYINEMDDFVSALEKVTDQKSAEKAAAAARHMSAEIEAMSEEFGDGVAMEQRMAIAMASRQQEMVAIQQRMTSQIMRIQMENPELMKMITQEMGK